MVVYVYINLYINKLYFFLNIIFCACVFCDMVIFIDLQKGLVLVL